MCFVWRERGVCQKCQKSRNSLWNYTQQGECHTSFQSPNVQHVESSAEQWRKMASLLGNTEKLSKVHTYVRADELKS